MQIKIFGKNLLIYIENKRVYRMKHKDYMNNLKRDATYTICLEKVKIVYPKANIKWLKKNIKNMRTAFRKELKKVSKIFINIKIKT